MAMVFCCSTSLLLKLLPSCVLPLLPAILVFRLVPRNLGFTLPHWNVEVTMLNVAVPLIVAGIVYGVGLLMLCWLLRIDEVAVVLGRFLRHRKRSAER